MDSLKLIALDEEDLEIFSSHLQDAVLRVADMAYLPSQNRFVAVLNRFDWEKAVEDDRSGRFRRRRAALRFDRVMGAQIKQLRTSAKDQVLSLLAIQFEKGDSPSGSITLTFSGGASIRLEVECIEAELKDLGPVWQTRAKPEHSGNEPGGPGS